MKSFQSYFYEAKKIFEFRIKIAAENGLDKDCEQRIKTALEAFKVETVSAPKRLPIQEHRDFPKVGPCECYIIDVGLGYPTIPEQVRQLVIERCGIKADCVCVFPVGQYEQNEEFEAHGKDHEGALLDEETLQDEKGAQDLVGGARKESLVKELSKHTRKYEFAAKEKNLGVIAEPTGNKSPVGSRQNKIPSPVKGR